MSAVLRWLRRCHFPLLFLLGVSPAALLVMHLWDAALILPAGMLYLLMMAMTAGCSALSGRRRLLAGGACAAALLALGCAALPVVERPLLLLLPLAAGGLLLASLPYGQRRAGENSPVFYFFGLGVHIVIYAVLKDMLDGRAAGVDSMQILATLFAAYMLTLLLALNRISLDNATLGRHPVTRPMRVINVTMTAAFLALALLLSFVPALALAVHRGWLLLREGLRRVGLFLLNLLPSDTASSLGAPQAMTVMEAQAQEPVQPGLFSIVLEYVVTALAVVVVIAGAAVLLRLIFRALVRLVCYLAKRFKLYVAAATEDYIDEITDTREDGVQRESRMFLIRRRRARAEGTTPGERIRVRYARLLDKRPQWSESSTARENLPEEAAALYERARYSEHEMTRGDETNFEERIKKIR